MSLLMRRGIMSSAKGGIFPLNTSLLDGSTQLFTGTAGTFSGATQATIICRVKVDTLSHQHRLFSEPEITSAGIRLLAGISTSGDLLVAMRDTDGGSAILTFSTLDHVTVGIWVTLGFVVDTINNLFKCFVNGLEVSLDAPSQTMSPIISGAYFGGTGTYVGAIPAGVSGDPLEGSIVDLSLWDRTLSDAEHLEYHNSGNVKPYNDLSAGLKVNLQSNWSLANGGCLPVSSELTDNAGSINLTNVGSTPFTGSGINVEC